MCTRTRTRRTTGTTTKVIGIAQLSLSAVLKKSYRYSTAVLISCAKNRRMRHSLLLDETFMNIEF